MESLSDKYLTSFDPQIYLRKNLSSFGKIVAEAPDGQFTWVVDRFHEIFQTGMIKGGRLLDIGTGPNIYSVISASSHCESIFLSDLAPQNRDTLAKWLEGASPDVFHRIFQHITAKEGKGEAPGVRESEVKKKITAILPVDVLQDEPLAPCHVPKLDIITSSLCLEAVTTDCTAYEKIVKRVMSLLKPGGHLVTGGVFECSFYRVGDIDFKTCYLTRDQVKDAWTKNGLKIVIWKEEKVNPKGDSIYGTMFAIYGQKLT